MIKLTKEKAEELNLLFDKMQKWEGEKTLAYLNIFKVSKSIDELKDKSEEYIRSLLYLARQEQRKIPELFSGDTLIALNDSSVRDFLLQGGFLTLYEQQKNEKQKDNFRFWSIFIITVITLVITLYQIWPSGKASQSKNQKEIQLKQKQKPVHQDSPKKSKVKTNSIIDTTKK